MGGQTFHTQAVVGLIDNLTGPLRQLASNAKAAVKQIEQMKVGDSSGLQKGMHAANRAARDHISLLGRIKGEMGLIVGLSGMYIANLARRGVSYEKQFDDEINRMRAFTQIDKETAEVVR